MSIYKPIRIFDSGKRILMVNDRLGYLSGLAKGKRVLHIGCTDYPIAEERIRAGQLLHGRLQDTASDLLGIDISKEGLQTLRAHGFTNIIEMDAEQMQIDREFDVVIAGDTLEHVSNPGLFLGRVRSVLANKGELVIGVPSAYSLNALMLWFRGRELTHHEHIAFHSPKTLAELCRRVDLLPTKLAFTVQPPDRHESSLFVFARTNILRMFKTMAPSIIMHFRKKESVCQDSYFEWK